MKTLILLTLFIFFLISVTGQTVTISGAVAASDTKEPLPGASIVIRGTSTGVAADLDGKFSIEVTLDDQLEFSYTGYLKAYRTVVRDTTIYIELFPDVQSLDEIVVIGYGIEKKSLVTGAISKVTSDEISNSASLRAEQALQGRVAGISVTQTSGQPGSGFTVRVRGTGSNQGAEPIYIVDGMRMKGIENININDIQSIEILKDAASAAIYGAQGANGVVLISTKSGKQGEASVNYKFYYGWQEIANKNFQVLNSHDYLDYRWRALVAEGTDSAAILNPAGTYHLPLQGDQTYNTNWLDEVLTRAPMFEHNISISGGNEKFIYAVSGSYFSQDGIAGSNKANFTRYSGRFNAEYNLKSWLKFSNKLNINRSERTSLPENSLFNNFMNRAINMDPLTPVTVQTYEELPGFVQIQQPDYVVRNSAGDYYGISDYVTGEVYNPLALLEVQTGVYTTDRVLGSFKTDIIPFKGFTYTNKFDFELAYGNNNYWNRKTYYNLENDNPQNGVSRSIEKWMNWQWGNIINYSKDINKHHVGILGGMEIREDNYRGIWANGFNLIKEEDNFILISSTVDSLSRSSDAISVTKWLSYFGRLSYNYSEKYIVNLVFRADGSSLFGPENQFGYFPSVSFGWIVSNEDFWNWNNISLMKLRASWGQNGSTSNLNPFQWAALIEENYQYPAANGLLLPAAEPAVLSNPDLKWEVSEQFDLGFEIAFLQNSLYLNMDYYRKVTKDLLTLATPANIYGNYPTFVNAGDVLNTGIELEASYKNRLGDLIFNINLNAAYNYNEVISTGKEDVLEGVTLFMEDGAITKFRKDYPVWYYSAYVTDGIFQTDDEAASYKNVAGIKYQSSARAGDVKFLDVNRDGTINSKDRIKIGDPNPDWLLGTNISLSYKQIDLGLFIQGAFGHQVVNALNRSDRFGYNKPQYYYDMAWDGEESTNDWFKPSETDPNGNFRNSDLFVEDAGYVRLKNLQIGYNFSEIIFFKNFGIQEARLYAGAQNLFTITKYKGLEPEIGVVNENSASSIGIDYGFYPISRIYQLGVNVTF